MAPHSIYTLSEAALQAAADLARRNGVPILIHIAEAPFETEQSRARHGLSPVAYLARIGLLGPDVVGAHCIWVDAADVATLLHFDVGSVHSPSSNMKLAAGVMPVVELLAAGNRVGLATDGAASNNSQDLFEEMDLAAKLQKVTRMDPRASGQAGAGDGDDRGRPGAAHGKADRVARTGQESRRDSGRYERTACDADVQRLFAVVYALKGSDVKTVVIDGRLVMEGRRMLTLNEKEILEKAREYQKRIASLHLVPALN